MTRVALWLLETLLPADAREAVIGDLVERFEHERKSPRLVARIAARAHFWREAIAAIVALQFMPDAVAAFTPYTRESLVQSFISDVRHGVRVLARSPGFTGLCVATLAIVIGATTAIFSVVDPVLLRPLPYASAERLVGVYERGADNTPDNMGFATYLDIRASATTFERSTVFGDWQPTIFGDRDAERVSGQRVSWEYFRTLGVRPALGRDFESADDTPDNSNVVLLSHGLWVRRFGGDPGVIGKTVNISGVSRTVVGVMPASFDNVLDPTAQIWRVLGYSTSQPWACRTCRHLRVVARLRDDVSPIQAQRQIDAIMTRVAAEYPKEYSGAGGFALGLQDQITREARPVLYALLGAVALVLLIGVANVVNLQLARAVRRTEEFAVRAALGAGRRRLAQQLFGEGLVLTAAGGTAGVALAYVALPALASRLPATMPRLGAVAIDWRALALVAAIVLVVSVIVGLAPALYAGRRRLYEALRGGRTLGGAHHRARVGIVVGEIALALMLMIGAALLGRSLMRLLSVNAGFDASHLVTMQVQATGAGYRTDASVLANHDQLLETVRRVPGVLDAALTTQLPMGGNIDRYGIAAKDKPLENPELAPSADRYTVSGDFLRLMRIPILRGRTFTDAEARDTNVHVVVVSDALASRIWGREDPVGKYIRLGGAERPWKRVIGVAGNIRHTGLDETVSQQVYIPERQWWDAESQMTLVARTAEEPTSTIASIRQAVRSVDPLQPISSIATMDEILTRSTAQRRLGLLLFVAFGAIALLLASAGIYGLLAAAVAERTRELGLRAALGATPSAIVGLVMRQGAGLAGVGLIVGGAAALVLTRYLKALLFGVGATDPVAIALGVLAIAVVSLAACLIPARRAVRVDPMTALRAD